MRTKDKLELIQEYVNLQAKDEGLWFEAETAAEAYLQKELRILHMLIECEDIDKIRNYIHISMIRDE